MAPSRSTKKSKAARKKGLAGGAREDMCEHCGDWFNVRGLGQHRVACGRKIRDAMAEVEYVVAQAKKHQGMSMLFSGFVLDILPLRLTLRLRVGPPR